MLDFDDLEEAEQENGALPETFEEKRKKEEAAWFKTELDFEHTAELRRYMRDNHRRRAAIYIQGVLVNVEVRDQPHDKAKEKANKDQANMCKASKMFFCDAVNQAVVKIKRVLSATPGDEAKFVFNKRLVTFVVFWMTAVQGYFETDAVEHFQKIVNALAGEGGGLAELVAEWLHENTPGHRRRRLKNEISAVFQIMVASTQSAIELLAPGQLEDKLSAILLDQVVQLASFLCPKHNEEDHGMPHWAQQKEHFFVVYGFRLMRVTQVSACQILYELRERFVDFAFQDEYKELRGKAKLGNAAHQEMVTLTWSVQRAILPLYGYEASARGLNEMRADVGLFAGRSLFEYTGPDKDFIPEAFDGAVWKMRRDIHWCLDLGRALPSMPVARPLIVRRFNAAEKDAWLRHLADEGFVVIAGVASEKEVETAYSYLWDFIEASDANGAIHRADLQTWQDSDDDGCGWPAGKQDGIIHDRGIGQAQVLWYLRSLENVRQVFADIWGTKRLVTSFDGAGVFRPYGHDADWKIKKTKQGWCHVDQGHTKTGLHCIQGLLTLKDATEKTGGLVVVPGSQRFYEGHTLRDYRKTDRQFIEIAANDAVLTEGNNGPRMVCAKAGDLLLWDSRTIHCNTPPLVEDQAALHSNDLLRAVCYICMTPAAWCSTEVLEKRQKAFARGVTTAHWPHEYYSMSATERHPNFSLSGDMMELVRPTRFRAEDVQAPAEGRVSLFPPREYVAAQDLHNSGDDSMFVPIRSLPTYELGRQVGLLYSGQQVSGYKFGRWLRLTSWPQGQVGVEDGEEAWAPIRLIANPLRTRKPFTYMYALGDTDEQDIDEQGS